MVNDLDNRVLNFLANKLSLKPEKIEKNFSVFHDLKVDGDDALDLIEAYSAEFEVNIEEFAFEEYFGDEAALGPISFLLALIGKGKEMKPLFVQDLIDSAQGVRMLK